MQFFRRSALTPEALQVLEAYDRGVRSRLGPGHTHQVRMRDWELLQVLAAVSSLPAGARILDTGAFNTYSGLYLRQRHPDVTVSDLLPLRAWKSFLRRLSILPAKPTEIGYADWIRAMRTHGLKVCNLDLTKTGLPDGAFDCIISLSVIEHIPAILLGGANDERPARFYGVTAGYEFSTLIQDILDLSTGNIELTEATLEWARNLQEDVHIQVFSTPT